jgi:FlaA1/EpsC-like NDP-sugar epimerase
MKSRPQPSLSEHIRAYFRGKRVMITGACGTVGQQLVDQLLNRLEIATLTGIDHNESELMFLEDRYSRHAHARFRLCDIRDLATLLRETRDVDVLFHAAAYKHVYICERSPLEAIQTNVLGVQNIVQCTVENGIERLVFTSSDKAVNPTNVMGTSKLMGERLVTAAAIDSYRSRMSFLSTRFGNVLGSRGSVIPIFRDQIRRGGPVTLSDPRMTRFIMSLDEAVSLVVESAVIGQPGDVLITKMPAINIGDLAQVMIREQAPRFGRQPEDIELRVVGPRAGEKLYEELMNEEETRRSVELNRYFVVRPAMLREESPRYDGLVKEQVDRPYNSSHETPLSQRELAAFLYENDLIDTGPGTVVR